MCGKSVTPGAPKFKVGDKAVVVTENGHIRGESVHFFNPGTEVTIQSDGGWAGQANEGWYIVTGPSGAHGRRIIQSIKAEDIAAI